MIFNTNVKKAILEENDEKLPDIIRIGKHDGMQDFTMSLKQLVDDELIDREVAMEVAPESRSAQDGAQGHRSEGSRDYLMRSADCNLAVCSWLCGSRVRAAVGRHLRKRNTPAASPTGRRASPASRRTADAAGRRRRSCPHLLPHRKKTNGTTPIPFCAMKQPFFSWPKLLAIWLLVSRSG